MFLFPFAFLLVWLAGLLSLSLLGGGVYLIYAWYVGIVIGIGYLIGGVVMLLVSLLGRPLVLLLLGRHGADEPHMVRGGETHRIAGADGTELQVEVYGRSDAPTLVLTHGWGLNSTEWYYAKQALAERFRLIVWDLRGLGESTRPNNNDYHLERMAHDLRAVVDFTGKGPVTLVGHSIGGMIMLTFCRLFPQELGRRVQGLVLTNTTYTTPTHTILASSFFRAIQKPIIEPLTYLTIWLAPVMWLMNWLSYLNGSLQAIAALAGFAGCETRGQIDFVARFQLLAWPGVAARGSLGMMRFDETDTLPHISVPTLVVGGDHDRLTRPHASLHMGETIPNADLVMLQPSGHMGVLEQHDQFAQAVEKFVAETQRRASERAA